MHRFNGQTVVLTGAAGFIGSHVAEALLRAGARVIGVDNFDPFYDPAQKRSNVEAVGRAAAGAPAGPGAWTLLEADICDGPAMGRAMALATSGGAPTTLVHLAAKAGVRPSLADPAGYARTNVHGTAVLLAEAARAGVRRAVVASSSSVYGNCPTAPFAEDADVDRPISPYAATKRACEILGYTHHATTGMPTAMLRFFTVYGPRQRPDLAIEAFMRLLRAGRPLPVFGDGSMQRDYTYIDDVVSGVLAAAERIDRHGYRVWNLGSDRPVALRDMVAAIGRVAGVEPTVERRPTPPGDVERTWADLTRSRAELGYAPSLSFEEGLRRQWGTVRAGV